MAHEYFFVEPEKIDSLRIPCTWCGHFGAKPGDMQMHNYCRDEWRVRVRQLAERITKQQLESVRFSDDSTRAFAVNLQGVEVELSQMGREAFATRLENDER